MTRNRAVFSLAISPFAKSLPKNRAVPVSELREDRNTHLNLYILAYVPRICKQICVKLEIKKIKSNRGEATLVYRPRVFGH
jgi:hypothetical protein